MKLKISYEEIDLERVFAWIMLIALITSLVIIFYALTQDHTIKCYYIDQNEGKLYIKGDIDWGFDSKILLDRSITYDEAINLVNRMNNEIDCGYNTD